MRGRGLAMRGVTSLPKGGDYHARGVEVGQRGGSAGAARPGRYRGGWARQRLGAAPHSPARLGTGRFGSLQPDPSPPRQLRNRLCARGSAPALPLRLLFIFFSFFFFVCFSFFIYMCVCVYVVPGGSSRPPCPGRARTLKRTDGRTDGRHPRRRDVSVFGYLAV